MHYLNKLPSYIYGRDAAPDQKVWTEPAIRSHGCYCAAKAESRFFQMANGEFMPRVVATAPERLYLVIGTDADSDTNFDELEVTWCTDKIDENSIAYVRADIALQSRGEPVAEVVEDLGGCGHNHGARVRWLHTSLPVGSFVYITRTLPADPAGLTDDEVDYLLSTPIPGGSHARDWFVPHEREKGLANVRDVVRRMFAATQAKEPQ